jgi:hypothetical protein
MAPGPRRLIGDAGCDADRVRQTLLLRGVPPVIPANPVRLEPSRWRSTAASTGCGTGWSGW